jgi:hypothetical protein
MSHARDYEQTWELLLLELLWIHFMMMVNDDDYLYGIWYFLLEGVPFG